MTGKHKLATSVHILPSIPDDTPSFATPNSLEGPYNWSQPPQKYVKLIYLQWTYLPTAIHALPTLWFLPVQEDLLSPKLGS